MTSELAIAFADVAAAADRIEGLIRHTELRWVDSVGIWAKLECNQVTGAFKARGATNAIRALRPKGVITGSSGNFGVALAYAAREANVPRIVVVLAAGFSPHKRARMERCGAVTIETSGGNTERDAIAAQMAEEEGLVWLSAFDNPLVIAGQGTAGIELATDNPDLKQVFVPIGGGGLISGIATALRTLAPDIRIIGVEPEGADDTKLSVEAGERVTIPEPDTVCDGVRATTPGELTFPIIAALVDEIVTVPDALVLRSLRALSQAGIIAEPTGALAVAAAQAYGEGGQTAAVVSGGNISPERHAELLATVGD